MRARKMIAALLIHVMLASAVLSGSMRAEAAEAGLPFFGLSPEEVMGLAAEARGILPSGPFLSDFYHNEWIPAFDRFKELCSEAWEGMEETYGDGMEAAGNVMDILHDIWGTASDAVKSAFSWTGPVLDFLEDSIPQSRYKEFIFHPSFDTLIGLYTGKAGYDIKVDSGFLTSLSKGIAVYVDEKGGYDVVRIPSYTEIPDFFIASCFEDTKEYTEFQKWLENTDGDRIYYLIKPSGFQKYSGLLNQCAVYLFPENSVIYKTAQYVDCYKFLDSESYTVKIGCYLYDFYGNGEKYTSIPLRELNDKDKVALLPELGSGSNRSLKYQYYNGNKTIALDNVSIGSIFNMIESWDGSVNRSGGGKFIFAKTPRYVKRYKSLQAAMDAEFSMAQAGYYIDKERYDSYQPGSTGTVTYSQGDINNGYIYNQIDNSVTTGMSEDEVQALITSILRETGNGSGTSSGNGSGSSGGTGDIPGGSSGGNGDTPGGSSGGTGIIDFIKGLGAFGDALLSIIGNVIEIAGGLIKQLFGIVTGLASGLEESTGQAGELIAAFFPFIPPEIISAITLGIVAIILIAVVKEIRG